MQPKAPGAKRRILMVGPHPPPYGGWAHAVDSVSRGEFRERFHLIPFDTKVHTHVRGRRGRLGPLLRVIRQILAFPGALRRSEPDLVLLFIGSGATLWRDLVLLRVARRKGIPVLVRVVGGVLHRRIRERPDWQRRIMEKALSRAGGFLTETTEMASGFTDISHGVPASRIHNVLQLEDLPEPRQPESPFRVIYFGNLVESKGVETILAAVDRVRADRPVEFHIVGGEVRPGYEERFAEKVSRLEHRDAVHVHGRVPRERVLEIARECHLFLLPTRWPGEGQPAALLEAMGMGLVPVATDWRGLKDIIRHDENGVLIPVDDPDSLVAAILELAGDPDRRQRLSEAARRTVRHEHGAAAVVETYQARVEEVLARGASS